MHLKGYPNFNDEYGGHFEHKQSKLRQLKYTSYA